ncbi:cytochrome-c peroxidase [Segetibacter aerophilus]|uniref:Cytochrome-c peroxidase n=1 Tax=Segetibacter aerophilus TaxID=670293 RepID=A0A512BGW5_9BACT|nr:cytochrome-c peroxidase [Segetibacter aerophilus]
MSNSSPTPLEFKVPYGWPAPVYNFEKNPLTQEGVDLGRRLFYDGRLSKDGGFPCASCHQQIAAFGTYDHNLSHGYNYSHTLRNAPPLQNLAWQKLFGWDGAALSIEQQCLKHINSVIEMGDTVENVLNRLRLDNSYPTYFKAAFGDETINADRMTAALTQFVLTMVSSNSRYDKVMRGEATFTLPEQTGYDIFKVKCASCHTEPLFTDNSFRNTGIPVDPFANDFGRFMVTSNSADISKFKVPSLRNTQKTFPYGHDGRFFFLDNVLEHYRSGIKDPAADPIVRNGISLSNYEIGQLKAFLYSLTDTGFINNRHFGEF